MKKQLVRLATHLGAAALVLSALMVAQPASAANRYFELRSEKNNWCLDADLNTINQNGTKVQLWPCNGQPQQRWYIDGNGWHSAKAPNRCVDVDVSHPVGNGTKLQLWDCNGWANQKWMFPVPVNNGNRVTGNIMSCYAGCAFGFSRTNVDADLNTMNAPGTKVQVWEANNQPQQRWTFTY